MIAVAKRRILRLHVTSLILDQNETSIIRHGNCLLGTFYARMASNADLTALLEATRRICLHIIAPQETRTRGTTYEILEKEQSSFLDRMFTMKPASRYIGDVGFIVHPSLVHFYEMLSPRLLILRPEPHRLKSSTIFNCHWPTSAADEIRHDAFHTELEEVIRNKNSF